MALKKHKVADLEKLYTEAERADSELFAEQRSNLLLIAGEQYNKRKSAFFRQIRDTRELNDQQKLRLTKNHTQNIVKKYVNNIVGHGPGVGFKPKNKLELQDQKAAELHHAVFNCAKQDYDWDAKVDDWADDFVGIGEVAVKIFWDEQAGPIRGYYLNEETGEEEPAFEGGFIWEKVYGFNLLRDSEAKDDSEAKYWIIRKMVNRDELAARFPEYKEKITASQDETVVVFDGVKGGYRKSENEVLLKEYYFKPSVQYPKGYYYFATRDTILDEDELPGGIFPLVFETLDKVQTSPRGRSIVKQIRPYQAEINRAASKIAEHQVTLGDDKIMIQNGSKVSSGASLPGIRTVNFTGMPPTVVQGRDGSQYLAYMQSQIEELYQVMGVSEDMEDTPAQLDPHTLLFRAASQKKRFKRYIRRFERFLIKVAKTYLSLAKIYLPEDKLIYAIGRSERVNITEFKNALDLNYEIIIEAQSDDVETKLGQQLAINHVLQYTASQMGKEDIGKFIRLMPYANMEEGFSDLTLDYDAATNDLLALDRGEEPPVHEYDNHVYMIKRLVSRMRQADFKFLAPEVQLNYMRKVQAHEELEAIRLQKIKQAQAEFIPTGGYMVACDLYVPKSKEDPTKTQRARIPYEALTWLIKQLEAQGQSLEVLEQMNQGALAQMSDLLLSKQPLPPANGMAGGANPGEVMPMGEINGRRANDSAGDANPGPISGINPSAAPNYGGRLGD